jgi:hypothetical protein
VLGILKAQQESLDYEYMHHWAAEFDLDETLEQVTLEAGVRELADQQWAVATYAIVTRAFAVAQARNRITQPHPDVDVADGNRYQLTRDRSAQVLTVVSKLDDREVVRYDLQGNVLKAAPSLQDRQQWQDIARRV